MAYSLSRINLFKACPNAYKLKYIDKVESESSEALEKGTLIHEALEHLNDSNEYVSQFFESDLGKKYKTVIENAQKEVKIGIDLKDKKLIPCSFSDECLYRGVIDVLYNNTILDYKSGKYRKDQSWSQLKYYALWLFLNSDYEEINVSYIFIEHNLENSMTIHRKEVNNISKELITDIYSLMQYDENPIEICNVSWRCPYCSVRKFCKKNVDNLLNL